MSSRFPFCRSEAVLASAVAALMLLTPASVPCAHAQSGQQAALKDTAKADAAKPADAPTTGTADPANPAQKSAAVRAIDKVKEVAKSAGDIFSRVPCQPPKGGKKTMGSLPHVASRLVAG